MKQSWKSVGSDFKNGTDFWNNPINKQLRQLKKMKFRGTKEEAKEYKIIFEDELKKNIAIPIRKEQLKWYNPTFMIQKVNGKWRKILDAKSLNKQIAEFYIKSTRFQQVQKESQPYLAFELQNNHYTHRAMQFGIKHSPIHFATAMEPIMQLIRMKTEIRIINYVDYVLFFHLNMEYLKNMIKKRYLNGTSLVNQHPEVLFRATLETSHPVAQQFARIISIGNTLSDIQQFWIRFGALLSECTIAWERVESNEKEKKIVQKIIGL
ncbi:MAG: hypothetical protein EZS28_021537 [Streblomastix strix]|uniref:Reverse transcriptase domain-containing protein n=1 Tax=Streblomastix strix TaxID=222440 RepID=A0A5J4VK13_9EUKA|nr:MAG: hypothetical protein EZS28_021537 [Streblomastix strix]